MNDTFDPPAASRRKQKFALRASLPRPLLTVEHSMQEFTSVDGGLYELFEVVTTASGKWICDYEWRKV